MSTDLSVVRALPNDQAFMALFNRLCVALREPQDGTGVTQKVYWDALRDVPMSALEGGATRLMREPGRKWFPTVAEWRTQADLAREDILRQAVRPPRDAERDPWREECRDCGDTGWVRDMTCDGGMDAWPETLPPHTNIGPPPGHRNHCPWVFTPKVRATERPRSACCGRARPHLPHDYTLACACRPTNRTYLRHQAFGTGAA